LKGVLIAVELLEFVVVLYELFFYEVGVGCHLGGEGFVGDGGDELLLLFCGFVFELFWGC
jgi:hypothetical protein